MTHDLKEHIKAREYAKAKRLTDLIDEFGCQLRPWQLNALDACLDEAIAIVRDDRRRAERRRL